jgi:hypothetical protein
MATRPKKISTLLSVGLTSELAALVNFASNNSGIPPSIWARIALSEKIHRENWPQIAAQYFTAQGTKS